MQTSSPRESELFTAEPGAFESRFDRDWFAFDHRIDADELFEPRRLVRLAQTMAAEPRDVYFDAGDVAIGQRWDQVPLVAAPVEQLLERIETANAWIVLFNVQRDPAFARYLDSCMAEIEARCDLPLRRLIKRRQAIVFVNSPGRITPFHIDRECSILMQMRGTKTIHLYSRDDRDVVTERELERFWTVDNNAASYKPQFAARASAIELTPGRAVHIPVNTPHWLRNGPHVSVSLNINFHYHDRLLGDVYRTNYYLRKLGLRPTPPRRSVLLDHVKGTAYDSMRRARSGVNTLLGRERPPEQ